MLNYTIVSLSVCPFFANDLRLSYPLIIISHSLYIDLSQSIIELSLGGGACASRYHVPMTSSLLPGLPWCSCWSTSVCWYAPVIDYSYSVGLVLLWWHVCGLGRSWSKLGDIQAILLNERNWVYLTKLYTLLYTLYINNWTLLIYTLSVLDAIPLSRPMSHCYCFYSCWFNQLLTIMLCLDRF